MLGNAANHSPLEEVVFFAQRGPAFDNDMAFQNTLGPDRDIILDDAEGSNLNAVAKSCRGSNQRQRVNKHNGHLEAVEIFVAARDDPAARKSGLTVLIGQRKPADMPDYNGWSGFTTVSVRNTPGGSL
jgi:hypothetical protein